VKIRHKHQAAAATVEALGGGRARVMFDVAQRAITPGQAAVIYDGDVVLAGGWIR
jgi:tRNA-specific 2-thiouridylase